MFQPQIIKLNDKAIIISPSGDIEPDYVYGASSILSNWGLDVEISPNALRQTGRFSGTVKQRLSDLQSAMDDDDTKVIFCSRGGYGIVHLIDKLNFSKIRQNPKWVIGYSDITALHSALQANGLMSIHAPMAKHFTEEGELDLSVRHIKSILEGNDIIYNIDTSNINNVNGIANGQLFGGNLTVFCGLLGTDFSYVPPNGILFLEDIGEAPYKVDRYIHQLKLSGVFNKISGLIIGQFTEYEEDPNMYSSLYQSISNTLSKHNFPICFNFPVGHVRKNLPLIMGKEAKLIVEDNNTIFKQTF